MDYKGKVTGSQGKNCVEYHLTSTTQCDGKNDLTVLYRDTSRNIIIFHHNDNDGRLAAFTIAHWIDTTKNPDNIYNIIYVECNHTSGRRWVDFIDHIANDSIIIGVDLALAKSDLSPTVINKLNKTCLIWSDHHIDTMKSINAVNAGEIDEAKFPIYFREDMCGAALAYLITEIKSFATINSIFDSTNIKSYLDYDTKIDELPNIYRLVDIRDRFLMDSKFWDVATGLHIVSTKYNTIPTIDPINNFWRDCCFTSASYDKYISEGMSLKEYRDSLYAITYRATAIKVTEVEFCDGNTYDFIAINGVGGSELFGGEDLKDDYDFCMIWHYTGKEYKYSIFTNKEYSKRGAKMDLQHLAELIGGGGHLHAAGFTSAINLLDLSFMINKIKL